MSKRYREFVLHAYPHNYDILEIIAEENNLDLNGNGECESCVHSGYNGCDLDGDCDYEYDGECIEISSAGHHIHYSPESYTLYEKIYLLTLIFKFFFHNSPTEVEGKTSRRISYGEWVSSRFTEKRNYGGWNCSKGVSINRHPLGTLEFRYNDLTKSLNQLAMFYYIINIGNKLTIGQLKRILIEASPKKPPNKSMLTVVRSSGLDKTQFKDGDEILIGLVSDGIQGKLPNLRYWDFNTSSYKKFNTLTKTVLKKDIKEFKKYWKKPDEREWTEIWRNKILKSKIPEILIRGAK
jgi:hypothetical protein